MLTVSEPELPSPDIPLMVEGLLGQARTLVECRAPIETVKAILDHIAVLREGHG